MLCPPMYFLHVLKGLQCLYTITTVRVCVYVYTHTLHLTCVEYPWQDEHPEWDGQNEDKGESE